MAFALLFSCFYFFNLQFLSKLEASYLFIQKFLLNMNGKSEAPSKVLKLITTFENIIFLAIGIHGTAAFRISDFNERYCCR